MTHFIQRSDQDHHSSIMSHQTSKLPLHLFASILMTTSTIALAEQWATIPLGKPVDNPIAGSPPIKQKLESLFKSFPADGKPVILFSEGAAQCIIITPDHAGDSEKSAALLLKNTLEKMTGGSFAVLPESEVRIEKQGDAPAHLVDATQRIWPYAIWIGGTTLAKKEEITADDLRPEGYKLVTRGNWIFIVGRDITPSKLKEKGTYFGVASFLERHLGVRWLWPGELGTVIPSSDQLILHPIHEQDEPALPQRLIRNMSLSERAQIGLNLLKAGGEDYQELLKLSADWLANQRTGVGLNLQYRHAYSDWYERFGKTHPDWFALQPNGSREQHPDRPRMCKSNPEVAHQAALDVIEAYRKNPNLDSASISPNDGGSHNWFCMCEGCRELDPSNGNPIELLFSKDGKRFTVAYPSLTNRIATFYNRVAEEVSKTQPNARLGAYAYSAYRDVPLGITLHPSIIVGFTGLQYVDEALRQSDMKRWDGWCRHASSLFLRPNAFHFGDALPLVYPHRLGEDIKYCYQTGMVAADFDSLLGNWSTDGLNYYILAKLLWDPSIDVSAVVKDYVQSGFGPASEAISRYFATMEEATNRVAAQTSRKQASIESQLRDEERDPEESANAPLQPLTAFQMAYFEVFNQEFINSLRELLTQADKQAAGDEVVLARIAFLKRGLDYAEIFQKATVEPKGQDAGKRELLSWYRNTFREEPLAINSVHRLWRTGATFRHLK